jgi:hypothetical protein
MRRCRSYDAMVEDMMRNDKVWSYCEQKYYMSSSSSRFKIKHHETL